MLVPVRSLGRQGFIYDEAAFDISPAGIDTGKHLRIRDGRLKSGGGFFTFLNAASNAVIYGAPLLRSTGSSLIFFFADGSVERHEGGVVTDISPAIAFSSSTNWHHCQIGDHLIVTNGVDVPHSYGPGDSQLRPLSGWPSTHRCDAIRPANGFLMAINTTESGVKLSSRVRFSDLVDPTPSTLVTDWDETSTTNRAGVSDLADGLGDLIDLLPMGSGMMLYHRYGVTAARFVGGGRVFDFRALFRDSEGILNRRAVSDIGGPHLFVTANGVYVHDGAQKRSISRQKVTRYFQDQFESAASVFTFVNRREQEVWICYGTDAASDYADRAIVYNWEYDSWTPLDLPTNAGAPAVAWAFEGPEEFSYTTWNDIFGQGTVWNDLGLTWNELAPQPTQLVPYIVAPGTARVYRGDLGAGAVDGVAIESSLQQSYLDLDEAFRGSAPVKHLSEIYPLLQGSGTINFRIGASMSVQGPIYWGAEQTYDMESSRLISCRRTGQFFAIRMRLTSGGQFDLSGWDLAMEIDSAR